MSAVESLREQWKILSTVSYPPLKDLGIGTQIEEKLSALDAVQGTANLINQSKKKQTSLKDDFPVKMLENEGMVMRNGDHGDKAKVTGLSYSIPPCAFLPFQQLYLVSSVSLHELSVQIPNLNHNSSSVQDMNVDRGAKRVEEDTWTMNADLVPDEDLDTDAIKPFLSPLSAKGERASDCNSRRGPSSTLSTSSISSEEALLLSLRPGLNLRSDYILFDSSGWCHFILFIQTLRHVVTEWQSSNRTNSPSTRVYSRWRVLTIPRTLLRLMISTKNISASKENGQSPSIENEIASNNLLLPSRLGLSSASSLSSISDNDPHWKQRLLLELYPLSVTCFPLSKCSDAIERQIYRYSVSRSFLVEHFATLLANQLHVPSSSVQFFNSQSDNRALSPWSSLYECSLYTAKETTPATVGHGETSKSNESYVLYYHLTSMSMSGVYPEIGTVIDHPKSLSTSPSEGRDRSPEKRPRLNNDGIFASVNDVAVQSDSVEVLPSFEEANYESALSTPDSCDSSSTISAFHDASTVERNEFDFDFDFEGEDDYIDYDKEAFPCSDHTVFSLKKSDNDLEEDQAALHDVDNDNSCRDSISSYWKRPSGYLSSYISTVSSYLTNSTSYLGSTLEDMGLVNDQHEILENVDWSFLKSQAGKLGLMNLGNTCFMNSALQCLAHTQDLNAYFLMRLYKKEINRTNPLGMKGQVAEAYAHLVAQLWPFMPKLPAAVEEELNKSRSDAITEGKVSALKTPFSLSSSEDHKVIVPRMLKDVISRYATQFSGYQQHDAQECLSFLLDGLHEDLNRITNKPYVERVDKPHLSHAELAEETLLDYKKRNESIITDLFVGLFRSTLTCPTCSNVSVTFDPFMYLSLPLPRAIKEWTIPFVWANLKLKPNLHRAQVNGLYNVRELKAHLSSVTSVPVSRIILVSMVEYEIEDIYTDDKMLEYIRRPSSLVAYEIPDMSNVAILSDVKKDVSCVWLHTKLRDSDAEAASVSLDTKDYTTRHLERNTESSFTFPRLILLAKSYASYPLLFRDVAKHVSTLLPLPAWLEWYGKYERTETEGVIVDLSMNVRNTTDVTDSALIDVEQDDEFIVPHRTENGLEEFPLFKVFYADTLSGQTLKLSTNATAFPISLGRSSSTSSAFFSFPFSPSKSTSIVNGHVTLVWPRERIRQLYEAFKADVHTSVVPLFDYALEDDAEPVDREQSPALQKDGVMSLNDCLDLFTQPETLGLDDPWFCPKCREHCCARKSMDIWMAPPLVLVVHLKRFTFNRRFREKLELFVDFPLEGLNLTHRVKGPNCEEAIYDLYAISNHFGGLGGGHYTAYVKHHVDGEWYHCDDSYVSRVTSLASLKSSGAYLLFYRRRDKLRQ